MSSTNEHEEHDPVANLHMQPAKGILKVARSVDDAVQDTHQDSATASANASSTTGMTRSESKSHKIPHFDEMNIIATYHPVDKDYGHMKIEEPKTPYAHNDAIEEEMDTEGTKIGVDPSALAQRLNESTTPASNPVRLHIDRSPRKSIDDDSEQTSEDLEHRKHFESHRKQHYNEFEVVRLRKKEIEAELQALEQEEAAGSKETAERVSSSSDSIKPILVHHHHSRDSSSSSSHQHHVHVEDDHSDDQTLTPEERERKKQFELKRKKHYNEFRAARLADKEDD